MDTDTVNNERKIRDMSRLLVVFFWMLSSTYAQTEQNMPPKAFGKQPTYKLKVKGKENKIEVFFNGVRVYKDDTFDVPTLIQTGELKDSQLKKGTKI